MSPIRFWYPVPCEDDQESGALHKEGRIRVVNLHHEPYEVHLNTNGYSFHLIFGSQENGHFLCIPDWNVGCELGPYDDRFWNTSSILHTGQIGHDEAYAIGNALDLMKILLNK